MKEKILAAIKAKFPDVLLSKKRLDEISDKLEGKITDESEIDAKVDEYNDYNPFAEIVRRDDAFANLQSKVKQVKQTTPPKKKKDDADDAEPVEPDDDMPAWFKAYKEQTDAKLQAFEKEKTVGTLKQKLAEKLKDVPKDFYEEWSLPENEEGLDAFTDKVTTKYDAFKQDLVNKGLAVQTKPGGGSGGGGNNKATPEEIKNITDKIIK